MDPKTLKRTQFSEHEESPERLESPAPLLPRLEKLRPGARINISFPPRGTVRTSDALERERRSASKPVISRNSILPIIIVGFNK